MPRFIQAINTYIAVYCYKKEIMDIYIGAKSEKKFDSTVSPGAWIYVQDGALKSSEALPTPAKTWEKSYQDTAISSTQGVFNLSKEGCLEKIWAVPDIDTVSCATHYIYSGFIIPKQSTDNPLTVNVWQEVTVTDGGNTYTEVINHGEITINACTSFKYTNIDTLELPLFPFMAGNKANCTSEIVIGGISYTSPASNINANSVSEVSLYVHVPATAESNLSRFRSPATGGAGFECVLRSSGNPDVSLVDPTITSGQLDSYIITGGSYAMTGTGQYTPRYPHVSRWLRYKFNTSGYILSQYTVYTPTLILNDVSSSGSVTTYTQSYTWLNFSFLELTASAVVPRKFLASISNMTTTTVSLTLPRVTVSNAEQYLLVSQKFIVPIDSVIFGYNSSWNAETTVTSEITLVSENIGQNKTGSFQMAALTLTYAQIRTLISAIASKTTMLRIPIRHVTTYSLSGGPNIEINNNLYLYIGCGTRYSNNPLGTLISVDNSLKKVKEYFFMAQLPIYSADDIDMNKDFLTSGSPGWGGNSIVGVSTGSTPDPAFSLQSANLTTIGYLSLLYKSSATWVYANIGTYTISANIKNDCSLSTVVSLALPSIIIVAAPQQSNIAYPYNIDNDATVTVVPTA